MDPIITKRATERDRNAGVQPPPPTPLLDSPLPTPRRSCASFDASRSRLRCRGDASPLRNHVPFSWESSPGVPKNKKAPAATMPPPPPPPRPPPGRPQPPCLSRNIYYYSNTSEASSDDDDRSFSDALDRISSPERTGSFDRITSKRFEDIFVGRATSFAKDRSSRHDNQAADFSASGRQHPSRQPRRGGARRGGHDEEDGRRWMTTPRLLNDNVPMQLMQRIRLDAEAEEMTPRACGLMVFFPWSAKPAVCGFRGIPAPAPAPAQHATATPRPGGAGAPSSRSHSRRITTTPATTLRDVIKEDKEAASGELPQQPRGEKKRVREDLQQSRRWGVSSLLDTSKKYCTDARKALSKLSIGLGADSGTPRVSSERMRTGKLHDGFSSTPGAPAKLTHLKTSRN
ncbi:unnamed protein product [Urochloa decumbens]|uniref:Uncharacterized protein n=1 Tax=Urochloa decumbens TaxID=240449 RepID=A0ABC9A8U8_9POAL